MRRKHKIDAFLLMLMSALLFVGVLLFGSAAFGLLARGDNVIPVLFSHIVLGIGIGGILMLIVSRMDYKWANRHAILFYVLSLIATAMVFVPHLGATFLGGRRWLILFGFSFQPSETMKLGVILMLAYLFSKYQSVLSGTWRGLMVFSAVIAPTVILLLLQPDLGTLGVICITGLATYIVAGARLRDVSVLIASAVLVVGFFAVNNEYVKARINTFLNPGEDTHSSGYQVRQSLIALGSGQLSGRGFGQGVQKFTYLPEPMGDSIFAVAGEELGFVGTSSIIILYLLFLLRGYAMAARSGNLFGSLVATGVATYIGCEAMINAASMLGLAPLTGIPLPFVSQGGSAVLMQLISVGILLSITRTRT